MFVVGRRNFRRQRKTKRKGVGKNGDVVPGLDPTQMGE